jgi:phosphosulfolactate phosphohydrolase-like enzyme
MLRAFSTAAYAFAAGVQDITIVSTVAEALDLRERSPGSLVMGEVDGLLVPGFNFSNPWTWNIAWQSTASTSPCLSDARMVSSF